MIRIDALWLCVAPVDMRCGAERLLAHVITCHFSPFSSQSVSGIFKPVVATNGYPERGLSMAVFHGGGNRLAWLDRHRRELGRAVGLAVQHHAVGVVPQAVQGC